MLKNRWCLLVHAALGLVLASSLGEAARADFVVNLTEFGGDVVATGSGTIDTAALTLRGTFAAAPELIAADGLAIFGHYNVSGSTGSFYSGISGPATFGNGGGIFPNLGTGDLVGIYAFAFHEMVLPARYVSGSLLSSSNTWTGQSFRSLGLTPGTYTWTWGAGVNADSFKMNIGTSAVPEPASFVMLGTGAAVVLGYARRRNVKSSVCDT